MESGDAQLSMMCAKERRIDRMVTLTAVGIGCALGYGGWKALDAIHVNRVSKLKEQSATSTQDRQMMKAACEGNVDKFDKALKDGANFNALNHEGRNALMISIAEGGDCEVAYHILSNSELAKKIDYKQVDDKGSTVLDIIDHKLTINSSERLQTLKRMVSENLEQQKQEESAGKARSNTCYDFQIVRQNMQRGR